MTHTVNITCLGTDNDPHPLRTAAQYHDKYSTSWELTANFGPTPYGNEREILRVPDAAPGDESRMRVTIKCPEPRCKTKSSPRWEVLHARLETARGTGKTDILLKTIDRPNCK